MSVFFVADEADDLLVVIDECLDAADCEYMGAAQRRDNVDEFLPLRSPLRLVTLMMTSPKAEELPWAIAELSESWWSVVYGYSDDNWTEFFPGSPRTPRPADANA